jgi:hypothetical protein
MNLSRFPLARFPLALIGIAAATYLCGPPSHGATAASAPVDEHRPADPQGEIEITLLSGHIEVVGWDKPEIAVSGSLGSDPGKLDLAVSGKRATLRLIRNEGSSSGWLHWGLGVGSSEPQLTVRIPRATRLAANLVSADLVVQDLAGEQDLRTVSGDVNTTVQGFANVHTVSGDIHLNAGPDSSRLELGSVSGAIEVTGGRGDISVETVSGDGTFNLGAVSRARFKTVSGDEHVAMALTADGSLEAESVSGDITVDFIGAVPAAQFELESFTGDLKACFGPKESHEEYGPGTRLDYTQGAGTGRVHIVSKSGDVVLCTKH